MGRETYLNLRIEIHINRNDILFGKLEGRANDLSHTFEDLNLPYLNKV